MQTPEQLRRVAKECALDLAADGVVYAESRFAPELHIEQGLELDAVVEAVLAGFREGEAEAEAAGMPIRMNALLTAMRHAAKSQRSPNSRFASATAELAASTSPVPRPASAHPAPRCLRVPPAENAHFTIHAGEAFGLPSIWEAIQWCGADRLGHGVRIIDDIATSSEGGSDARPARGIRPRLPDPARDVPDLQPADRWRIPLRHTRSRCSRICASASRSTPTTG
jgi:adenosine deaminase